MLYTVAFCELHISSRHIGLCLLFRILELVERVEWLRSAGTIRRSGTSRISFLFIYSIPVYEMFIYFS